MIDGRRGHEIYLYNIVGSIASADGQVDGLALDCSNSRALAMELLQSCTKPSK